MSDFIDAFPEYHFGDKKYLVAKRDIFIDRQFELWVGTEAALALERMRTRVPVAFFQEQMSLLNSKIVGKQLTWDSPTCQDVYRASLSEEGVRHLLWLKIMRGSQKGGSAIPRELIDEIAKNKEDYQRLLDIMYQQDYPDFFERLKKEREEAKTGLSPSQ